MPKVIAVTPHYITDLGASPEGAWLATRLARAVARASRGEWRVEVLSHGLAPARRLEDDGVVSRIMRADHGASGTVLSWELPGALAGADLVHVYGPATSSGGLAVALAVQRHSPVCVTPMPGHPPGPAYASEPWELANMLVATSRHAAAGLPTRRPIRLIPNAVDTDFFVPPEPSVERTGVLAIGDCSGGEDCRRLCYQRALATVHVTGSGDRLDVIERSALESLACGTPVVCAPASALSEYVEHGVTGLVIDSPALLKSDLAERAAEEMGVAARERACQTWGLEPAGQQLLKLYRELLP